MTHDSTKSVKSLKILVQLKQLNKENTGNVDLLPQIVKKCPIRRFVFRLRFSLHMHTMYIYTVLTQCGQLTHPHPAASLVQAAGQLFDSRDHILFKMRR